MVARREGEGVPGTETRLSLQFARHSKLSLHAAQKLFLTITRLNIRSLRVFASLEPRRAVSGRRDRSSSVSLPVLVTVSCVASGTRVKRAEHACRPSHARRDPKCMRWRRTTRDGRASRARNMQAALPSGCAHVSWALRDNSMPTSTCRAKHSKQCDGHTREMHAFFKQKSGARI